MAPPEQTARGRIHPFVCTVLRRDGEWPTFTTSDLQVVKEEAVQADHTMDLQQISVHHGGKVLAH